MGYFKELTVSKQQSQVEREHQIPQVNKYNPSADEWQKPLLVNVSEAPNKLGEEQRGWAKLCPNIVKCISFGTTLHNAKDCLNNMCTLYTSKVKALLIYKMLILVNTVDKQNTVLMLPDGLRNTGCCYVNILQWRQTCYRGSEGVEISQGFQ